MGLKLYNTRRRSLEVFKPLSGNEVRLYCCGPTVYHFAHIGNLRTYIFEDFLHRTLTFLGYELRHAMNITDVGHLTGDGDDGEDKMIKAARERGMSVWDIAQHYTAVFFEDCKKLNIRRPEIVCRATEHISDMIDLIKRLESKGMTYQADGNVYYDVSKFPRYGEFARLDKQELRAGARIEVDSAKRNPADFVLWFTNSKFKDQAMVWDSPWGRGYPGWHIECSAMSQRYLGEQFDIHCGGVDHINVHHTNEIAQTEGATGLHPWVNFWLHGEFLVLNNAKMSKSSGDFLTLDRLAELGFQALDYRYFCLGAHYRTQLNFSDDSIAAAKSARSNLVDKVKSLIQQAGSSASAQWREPERTALSGTAQELVMQFESHISEDLNMPRALATVFDSLKAPVSTVEKLALVQIMDQVLGLELLTSAEQGLAADAQASAAPSGFSLAEEAEIHDLIAQRKDARAVKDFARSDAIRDLLKSRGVALVDTPQGTTFKRL